jgi:FlaA1/EpsC-like NDP-sugar epimerase
MGEPVRISDLAEQMIRFYGFEPEADIKIEYIGLRPGERLDERLWSEEEVPRETEYSRILRVDRKSPSSINLVRLMEAIKPICRFDPQNPQIYRNSELLRVVLQNAIPSIREQGISSNEQLALSNELLTAGIV